MKISNWHTSGRTNKTKDIDSTIFSVSGSAFFTRHQIRIAIRTINELKVSTATKHKTALKFCDINLTLAEANDLQLKLTKAINDAIEQENRLKQPPEAE